MKKACQISGRLGVSSGVQPVRAELALRGLVYGVSIAFEWKQRHESSALDRFGHRMLAYRSATGFSSTDDASVTIDQFLQELNVFVVDVRRPWSFTINIKWVFSSRPRFRFRFATVRGFSSHFRQWIGSLF